MEGIQLRVDIHHQGPMGELLGDH